MINQLIERIDTMVPQLRLVGGAIDFQAAVENNPKATPACFVIPMREQPGPSIASDVMQQKVTASIGVVLVVRHLGDTTGAGAGNDLEVLRRQVREQIYGWTPDPAIAPLERGAGQLLAFRDGHAWWQDLFTTSYYDRSVL
ncbi:hypothetical protein B0920_02060 [Massilia sp. KIM]|uniref:phage tail terminator protein n=1 Tax=Massilia sp. KIM TaxID=1955422 RepID=UPI00098F92B5|nr:hypothetical protein [Massilia sp. KIM]OON62285.1 hypothetical protein B0920_02060 [Massilia sp. KIM]